MPHFAETLAAIFTFLSCTVLFEVALSANKARMKDRLISKIKAAEESLMQWVVIFPWASWALVQQCSRRDPKSWPWTNNGSFSVPSMSEVCLGYHGQQLPLFKGGEPALCFLSITTVYFQGRELQMQANVCRDFLILRYCTNVIIVCPPSCQNFFLKDVDVALHYFLLREPQVRIPSTDPPCALQRKENCYSSVKRNQTQKCPVSPLWSLHCFWAANSTSTNCKKGDTVLKYIFLKIPLFCPTL